MTSDKLSAPVGLGEAQRLLLAGELRACEARLNQLYREIQPRRNVDQARACEQLAQQLASAGRRRAKRLAGDFNHLTVSWAAQTRAAAAAQAAAAATNTAAVPSAPRSTAIIDGACAHCETPTPTAARFCSGCGLPVESVCQQCGTALAENARFCNDCGSPTIAQRTNSAPAATGTLTAGGRPAPNSSAAFSVELTSAQKLWTVIAALAAGGVVIGSFMDWITAIVAFAGQISASGMNWDGKFNAILGGIGVVAAVVVLTGAPRISVVILIDALILAPLTVYEYVRLQDRINQVNAQSTLSQVSIGTGLWVVVACSAILFVASVVLVHHSNRSTNPAGERGVAT